MLIKQEIQTIQHPKYKFTVEGKKTAWKVVCYKKDELSGFFNHMGGVMIISKNAISFKTLKAFREIESKSIKIKLLQMACNYMDERVTAWWIY